MPGSVIGSVFASSWKTYGPTLLDQIFSSTALWDWMKRHGRIKPYDGGLALVEDIILGRNTNLSWRDAKKTIPLNELDVMRQMQFIDADATGSIPIYRKDERRNANRIHDYVASLHDVTRQSWEELFGRTWFSDGTMASLATAPTSGGVSAPLVTESPDAREYVDQADFLTGNSVGITSDSTVLGLEAMISDGYTNTAGSTTACGGAPQFYGSLILPNQITGIDRTQNTWWASMVSRTAEPWSLAAGTDKGVAALCRNARHWGDNSRIDLIVTDELTWEYYNDLLTDTQRREDTDTAEAGFENLKYKSATMISDQYCPSGFTYTLCTDKIWVRPDAPNAKTIYMSERIPKDDVLAEIILLSWSGQITCTRPQVMGKMCNKTIPA